MCNCRPGSFVFDQATAGTGCKPYLGLGPVVGEVPSSAGADLWVSGQQVSPLLSPPLLSPSLACSRRMVSLAVPPKDARWKVRGLPSVAWSLLSTEKKSLTDVLPCEEKPLREKEKFFTFHCKGKKTPRWTVLCGLNARSGKRAAGEWMWASRVSWGSCGRVIGVRETNQKGAVWLRLFRRSVAVPEIGLWAAFVLSESNALLTKSLRPFCKYTLPFPLPCMYSCLFLFKKSNQMIYRTVKKRR